MKFMPYKLLVINPGSTSTKVAVFLDCQQLLSKSIEHSQQQLAALKNQDEQLALREQSIKDFLQENNLSLSDFQAIIARGGLLRPIDSGTYKVSPKMVEELQREEHGRHAANVGAIIAWQLSGEGKIPSYIVDPIVVDELSEVARVTGRPDMKKVSIFHALNQKAVAKRYAKSIGKSYDEMTIVVAHMGGGVSVGCHHKGRVIEVNNGLDGEGPFSPNRIGTVQAKAFAQLILTNNWDMEKIGRVLTGKSGVLSHLGTEDMREVEVRALAGEEKAKLVFSALAYQVSRYIAAACVAAKGRVQQIILTGGIAHSKKMTDEITSYIDFIAPVTVSPGEDELQALAEGGMRVLTGEEQACEY